MSTRLEKIAHILRVQISRIIHKEIKDPRLGFVTVMEVKITPDLKSARVSVSVMGDEKSKKESMEGLNSAAGYIQRLLGEALTMRFIPRIQFILDTSIDDRMRIEDILREDKEKKTDGS